MHRGTWPTTKTQLLIYWKTHCIALLQQTFVQVLLHWSSNIKSISRNSVSLIKYYSNLSGQIKIKYRSCLLSLFKYCTSLSLSRQVLLNSRIIQTPERFFVHLSKYRTIFLSLSKYYKILLICRSIAHCTLFVQAILSLIQVLFKTLQSF